LTEIDSLKLEANHLAYEVLQTGDREKLRRLRSINERLEVILRKKDSINKEISEVSHGA